MTVIGAIFVGLVWVLAVAFVISLLVSFTWVLWTFWPPLGMVFIGFCVYVVVGLIT